MHSRVCAYAGRATRWTLPRFLVLLVPLRCSTTIFGRFFAYHDVDHITNVTAWVGATSVQCRVQHGTERHSGRQAGQLQDTVSSSQRQTCNATNNNNNNNSPISDNTSPLVKLGSLSPSGAIQNVEMGWFGVVTPLEFRPRKLESLGYRMALFA